MFKRNPGKKTLQISDVGDHLESSRWSHPGNWFGRCGGGVETMPRSKPHATDDVMSMERALAAFHAAVAKEYGPEEAIRASGYWIEELEKSCAEERSDWRSVTVAAARRLASRVAAPSAE